MVTTIIASALSGGVVVAILSFVINLRKERRSDFEVLKEIWLNNNNELREQVKDYTDMIAGMQVKIQNLQNKVLLLESAHMDMPLPMWLKDIDGTMLAVNQMYEDIFLLPLGKTKEEYVGNKDVDMWGEELADIYRKNDVEVMQKKKPLDTYETVILNGTKTNCRVIKYPRYSGNTLIGIAGIAIHI